MGEHSLVDDQYDTTGGTVNVLGREPAQWIGLLSAAVALFSSLIFPLDVGQQGALIAVATAAFGIAGAMAVSAEKAAPLVAGLVQSVIALALAFGLQLSPEVQGSIMAFVAAGVAFYLRTQVTAPVTADGESLSTRPAIVEG